MSALKLKEVLSIESNIGRSLHLSKRRILLISLTALTANAVISILLIFGIYDVPSGSLLAGLGLIVYVWAARGNPKSLGLRLKPEQGWKYWIRVTALLISIFLACLIILFIVLKVIHFTDARAISSLKLFCNLLLFNSLINPVIEEIMTRLILCVPLSIFIGNTGAIIGSGLVFGGFHLASGYGVIPTLLAGHLLAWAFLKSKSILVPIVLHSLGNTCILTFSLAYRYYGS